MPTISSFYGIIVMMYYLDGKRHHQPHIHAKYQGHEVVVGIPSGAVLEGGLPPAKLKLLLAWVEIHKNELMADWRLAARGERVFGIEPLR